MCQEMKTTLFLCFLTTVSATFLVPGVTFGPNYTANSPVAPNLESWIAANMKELQERRANDVADALFSGTVLDYVLVNAEERGFKLIVVKKNRTGDFEKVTAAVDSIPLRNMQRVVIWISGGYYFEKFTITRTKNFVTLFGDPLDMPKIVFNGTAAEFGTLNSATVAMNSDYFVAVNIAFMNSAPMPDCWKALAQAVAMRISGNKAAFHNCKFIGFQDTLYNDRGMHFSKTATLKAPLISSSETANLFICGFTFLYCNITGSGNGTTYLGRAWRQRTRVIIAFTYMGNIVHTEGWSTNKHPERSKTVYYGEYKCMGPGVSSTGRVGFARILSEVEARRLDLFRA
ncbi:sucrose synthase-like [Hibiscus syriacus]|uniref:pectinesterase n=1 Tax=Hibiscus syriacus TaxID=106335 RepID=A0A6A2ZAY3_HIBSY|nr:sucrose synthase-like [Hibiscus syriacus]